MRSQLSCCSNLCVVYQIFLSLLILSCTWFVLLICVRRCRLNSVTFTATTKLVWVPVGWWWFFFFFWFFLEFSFRSHFCQSFVPKLSIRTW